MKWLLFPIKWPVFNCHITNDHKLRGLGQPPRIDLQYGRSEGQPGVVRFSAQNITRLKGRYQSSWVLVRKIWEKANSILSLGSSKTHALATADLRSCFLAQCQAEWTPFTSESCSHVLPCKLHLQFRNSMSNASPALCVWILWPAREKSLLLKTSFESICPTWIISLSQGQLIWDLNWICKHLNSST